jgi:tetratricopeptide (TPR) repeat protein
MSIPELANSNNWVKVQSVTKTLLELKTANSNTWDEERDMLVAYHLEALFRLKLHDELIGEVTALLAEVPEAEQQLDRLASLQLLLVEARLVSGRSEEAFELLCSLQVRLKGQQGARARFWSWHARCQEINALIRQRSWKEALRMLRGLFIQADAWCACGSEDGRRVRVVLLCRAAQLLLQMGARRASAAHHALACRELAALPALAGDAHLRAQTQLVRGLLLFSEERFEPALEVFSELLAEATAEADADAAEADEAAHQLPKKVEQVEGEGANLFGDASLPKVLCRVLWRQLGDCPASAPANNLALCCLHLKRNAAAVQHLEAHLAEAPMRHMTDPVVFNLCTMYDLCFSPEVSLARKKALQRVAARLQISDAALHWRSFRLN